MVVGCKCQIRMRFNIMNHSIFVFFVCAKIWMEWIGLLHIFPVLCVTKKNNLGTFNCYNWLMRLGFSLLHILKLKYLQLRLNPFPILASAVLMILWHVVNRCVSEWNSQETNVHDMIVKVNEHHSCVSWKYLWCKGLQFVYI